MSKSAEYGLQTVNDLILALRRVVDDVEGHISASADRDLRIAVDNAVSELNDTAARLKAEFAKR